MTKLLSRLVSDERGAALTEYGLLVGLIALAAVTGMQALGTDINAMFTNIGGYLASVKVPG